MILDYRSGRGTRPTSAVLRQGGMVCFAAGQAPSLAHGIASMRKGSVWGSGRQGVIMKHPRAHVREAAVKSRSIVRDSSCLKPRQSLFSGRRMPVMKNAIAYGLYRTPRVGHSIQRCLRFDPRHPVAGTMQSCGTVACTARVAQASTRNQSTVLKLWVVGESGWNSQKPSA